MNRSKFTEKEACNGTLRKLTAYQMGLKIPLGLDSEISQEGAPRTASEGVMPNSSAISVEEIK